MKERGRGGGQGVRTRDHLANVRTMLAFFRAGLTVSGIGFVIDKLQQIERTHAIRLGLPIAIFGFCLIAAAAVQFLVQRRAIEAADFRSHVVWNVGLVVVIFLTGALLLIWLSLN